MIDKNLPASGKKRSLISGLPSFARAALGKTRDFFSKLRTLTAMQLKEKMDLSYLRSFRKTLFKIIWTLIEFAAITAICFVIIYFIKLLGVFSLIHDLPDTVMSIVLTAMLALSLIFGTSGLVKSLYFSRDNMVLLTFPATSSTVFLSKLAVYYVYEFKKNFMFMIPLLIAYGINKNYPGYFYPWLLFMFVFISALPVIVSALLSIPCMFVYQWIRKVKILQYLIYILIGGALAVLAVMIIRKIPANLDLVAEWPTYYWKIQDFINGFSAATPIMYAFTQLILGRSTMLSVSVFTENTLPHLGILVGVTAVLLLLCFFSSKPLFYKMASKPFEYSKKANPKAAKNRTSGGFFSALKKECRIGWRSNALITDAVILVVVMPIAIFLLNKIYSAMNTRFLGQQMTVSFNALIMLLILLSTNINLASCYSRDGAASYLNKVQPKNYESLLVAKLVPNLVIGLIGTAATVFTYRLTAAALSMTNTILFGLTVYFIYVAHLFWSAEMDIMKPQYAQYATFSEQANNPNENMSALLVFVLSLVIFAVSLLLANENIGNVWIKLTILSAVLAVGKIITYLMKIKVFYRERV